MNTKEEVLQNCTVDGNVVKLPATQLDKKLYGEVKNAIEKIGGKWKGGKVFGFVFEQNPAEMISDIANGVKRNIQKEFQFFATPDKLADKLVALADIKKTDLVLEPSAGRGAIVNAVNRVYPNMDVFCYELMELNREHLSKIKTCRIIGNDFLVDNEFDGGDTQKFDKVIANPPFSKNQDIDHVYEMYKFLKSGGRLVSVTSGHWKSSENKKETAFKLWLSVVGARVQEIEVGAFKESGTMTGALMVIIDKN